MKLFIKKYILFFIPILIWVGLFILVDPFNYFNVSRFVSNDIKKATLSRGLTRSNEWALWKLLEYDRHNCENVIIGDSRIAALDVEQIKKVSNIEYFNYGIAGLDVTSICKIFWYINKSKKIKNVYIGLSFQFFKQNYEPQIFDGVYSYKNNTLKYLTSRWVFDCLTDNLNRKYFTNKENKDTLEFKNTSPQNIVWDKKLENGKEVMSYKLNTQYFKDLDEIVKYSKSNNINLSFIIFPEYRTVYDVMVKNKLEPTYIYFSDYFKANSQVYDFNNNIAITNNATNFDDPTHPNIETNNYIIDCIWGLNKNLKFTERKVTN